VAATLSSPLLVAGATGLVGRAVIDAARRAGMPVLALVRRAPPDEPATASVLWHPVDFAALPRLPPAERAVCALGTTISAAGSRAAFRAVDLDAVVAFARAAREAGVRRFAVVSALGAGVRAPTFYNRVKGEAEAAVTALGFDALVIARPSLLVGDRSRLGQPERPAERLAQAISAPLSSLIPAAWRPIAADTVARALLAALDAGTPGVRVVDSAELQTLGGPGGPRR
jgi:uncharacterized protein YbjT (DUF2867 family)